MIDDEGIARGVTTANWIDPPYNRWAFRLVSQVARTQRIGGSDTAIDLPRAERDLSAFSFAHSGVRHTLESLLEATATDGIIVLQDGAILAERRPGLSPAPLSV